MWGFTEALSPYWQLFESSVSGVICVSCRFCPEQCGALVGDFMLIQDGDDCGGGFTLTGT